MHLFIKLTTAPVLFKKPTPSQISMTKNAKKSLFIIEQIEKHRKCLQSAARGLAAWDGQWATMLTHFSTSVTQFSTSVTHFSTLSTLQPSSTAASSPPLRAVLFGPPFEPMFDPRSSEATRWEAGGSFGPGKFCSQGFNFQLSTFQLFNFQLSIFQLFNFQLSTFQLFLQKI